MRFSRMQAFASACCLFVPLALVAQTPTDPSAPQNPAGSATSQSPTSSQTTPGLAHTNGNRSTTGIISETGASGADMEAQAMKDRMFLKDASQGGMSEIQMGQLASDKATDPQVKAFGQKMVTDHTVLNNNLKPFADKMGVAPAAALKAEDQAELDKLNGLSGEEFDKEYVAVMMKDHAMDLRDFRKEASSASDPDLRNAVMKGQVVIEHHKHWIDKIGASMGVKAS